MKLSIVILAYNQTSTILLTCSRLAKQMSPEDGEIIIVDVSPVEIPQTALNFLLNLKAKISYVFLKNSLNGRSAGRNIGIEKAKGSIIVLLDGDMIPDKNFINENVIVHAPGRPHLLVAGHRTWLGEIYEAAGSFSILTDEWLEQMVLLGTPPELRTRENRELEKRAYFLATATPWRASFTCNLSFPKSDFVPFDETYSGWGFEDWDFAWKMFTRGIQPVFRHSINAFHIENAGCVGNIFRNPSQNGIIQYLQNSFYFYENCMDLPWDQIFFGSERIKYNQDAFEVVSRQNAIAPDQMQKHLILLRSKIDKGGKLYTRVI